ncbi:MAG: helix-turn-helix domain-containing protein [Clostridiales bacterium]|jgi:transcriptional regulator with XRE-family HTH domain|nr:helix-turn-helix domain-containing protein [Clostridiales bacterium]
MNIEIANRLVTLRKQFNFSQEDLAEKLGISRQAVSRWERAEASPDTDNLIGLAKLYGVSLDSLLSLSTDAEYDTSFARAQSREFGSQTPSESAAPDTPEYYTDAPKKDRSFTKKLIPVVPMTITIIYMIMGVMFNLWHPGWIIFMFIPLIILILNAADESER